MPATYRAEASLSRMADLSIRDRSYRRFKSYNTREAKATPEPRIVPFLNPTPYLKPYALNTQFLSPALQTCPNPPFRDTLERRPMVKGQRAPWEKRAGKPEEQSQSSLRSRKPYRLNPRIVKPVALSTTLAPSGMG